MGLFLEFAAAIIAISIGTAIYLKFVFTYWKRKGLPYLEPKIPFGNYGNPLISTDTTKVAFQNQYNELKSQGHKHGGLYLFTKPMYFPIDPEFVKNVMSKDFKHFTARGSYYNEKHDPLSASLINIGGKRWKNMRTKLSPAFTAGKVKMIFPILLKSSHELIFAMNEFSKKRKPVEIKNVLECFTMDSIGSCAFGLECNSFKDPNSEFREFQKMFSVRKKYDALKYIIAFCNGNLARFLRIKSVPPKLSQFFMNIVKDAVDYREKNNFVRKDFMQILIDLKNNVKIDDQDGNHRKIEGENLTIEKIAAQALGLFLAGFETSSGIMSFCLFELAMNLKIQERAREEVTRVLQKHQGKITYDAIIEMKYLGQVIDETLRMYPSVPVIPRKCVENYQVPSTNVVIEKGTRVGIPVFAIQRDREFYPDPDKFDPERFSEQNKRRIRPFTYIPFGEGPRICIGLRFAVIEVKLGVATLLKHFKFTVNQKTQVPLVMDPFHYLLAVKGGIWLDVEKV